MLRVPLMVQDELAKEGLMEKFNIQVDDDTVTQSALLHTDIPGYNLPALDFMSPSKEAHENQILEEEDSMIYMSHQIKHLC